MEDRLPFIELMFYTFPMTRPHYVEITCKSALNRVQGMPFKWSLNPYRGCVHACHYCYARASHTYYGMDGDRDFETKIMVKTNIIDVLRYELRRRSWVGEQVALGTVTDCYQPAEGRYRLTRGILEALLERQNPVSMVTKSPLVLRDLDLLTALADVVPVRVFFTITTVDERLWRHLEPGTAPPLQRLRSMRRLADVGICAGVLLAPILPGITDSHGAIDAVVAAAAEYHAAFIGSTVLRLAPVVKEHYLGLIERAFPDLLPRYLRAYPGAYAPRAYLDGVEMRVAEARQRHGFSDDASEWRHRSSRFVSPPAASLTHPVQLNLPL